MFAWSPFQYYVILAHGQVEESSSCPHTPRFHGHVISCWRSQLCCKVLCWRERERVCVLCVFVCLCVCGESGCESSVCVPQDQLLLDQVPQDQLLLDQVPQDQPPSLRNLEIAQRILRIRKLRTNLQIAHSILRLRSAFARSRDCAVRLRNLEIALYVCAISRLRERN